MSEQALITRRVDVHVHATDEPFEVNGITVADAPTMAEHLRSIGTDRAVVLAAFAGDGGEAASNAAQRAMADATDGFFAWGCLPGPEDPDTMRDRLARYKEQGATLVGEVTWTGFDFEHPVTQAMFAAAEEVGLPVLMHIAPDASRGYGLGDDPGLPQLEASLRRYPELVFIGHSQPFWHEISRDAAADYDSRNSWGQGPVAPGGRLPELLDRYDNLYCDLSANSGGQAIMRDPEFGLAFLEKYSDRLMFGSDLASPEMSFPLGDWLIEQRDSGALSQQSYARIASGNAIRILGL